MQGILNPILPEATWQILAGTRADLATLWLQALGTDAVIVPDRTSLEIYNTDYANPAKFRDILPILFDNRHGTVVYRIPRVHSGIGRVVDKETLGKIGKIRGGDDLETLTKYISVVENPDQPVASVAWHGFDEVDIRNTTSTGQSVLLQETFDPAWRAWDNGRPVAIRPEPTMNFMLIDVPEGDHAIQMRFRTPAENRAGQLLTAVSLLTALGLMLPLRKLWVARNSAWPGPEPVS
jgi:hypothetical protein